MLSWKKTCGHKQEKTMAAKKKNTNVNKFMHFLKRHDAVGSYYKNIFYSTFNAQVFAKSKHFVEEKPIEDYIDCAFDWDDSSEGFTFWESLWEKSKEL